MNDIRPYLFSVLHHLVVKLMKSLLGLEKHAFLARVDLRSCLTSLLTTEMLWR
jgi:hypothetical protein